MYSEDDLVAIARRENNSKRKYLVINRLQGKHIAVNPTDAFEMFNELAEEIKHAYRGEKLLLVGFAETATAIGAAIAMYLGLPYIHTTRERIDGVEYLYFSETHSHATEQKLVKTDLDPIIDEIDRVVFIEDEITTGNTILQIIDLIKDSYKKKINFSVASLLNGMEEKYEKVYLDRNIGIHYLVKTNHKAYEKRADAFSNNGQYIDMTSTDKDTNAPAAANANASAVANANAPAAANANAPAAANANAPAAANANAPAAANANAPAAANANAAANAIAQAAPASLPEYNLNTHIFTGCMNTRKLVNGTEYEAACLSLYSQILSVTDFKNTDSILVMGTEEFMCPALYTAKMLERDGFRVKSHSTSRTPVVVSSDDRYPLHTRFELTSMYDENRTIFVYDIDTYDKVIIITDAAEPTREGIESLLKAVASRGNRDISVVRWC